MTRPGHGATAPAGLSLSWSAPVCGGTTGLGLPPHCRWAAAGRGAGAVAGPVAAPAGVEEALHGEELVSHEAPCVAARRKHQLGERSGPVQEALEPRRLARRERQLVLLALDEHRVKRACPIRVLVGAVGGDRGRVAAEHAARIVDVEVAVERDDL